MTLLDGVLIRILFAASGSLVAGCAVWAAVVLCSRYLSAVAQQRTLWLLGQAAIAVVFMTVLLPTSDRLRMTPVIEIDEAGAPPASPITPPPARLAPAPAPEPAPATTPWHAWLVDAGRAWLVLYLLGLSHALHRWWRGVRLLDALAGCGDQLVELAGHAGFVGQTAPTLPAVIEIDAPISPMLHGVFRTLLILPRHLRDFHPLQQALIIEHELTHWRRHDLYWSVASHTLQSLFWFNPFVRMLGVRLACAQEFGCDRDVLRDRPQSQRKAYAAALLVQLKLQQRPTGMALAFGTAGGVSLSARIDRIRTSSGGRDSSSRAVALGCITAALCANVMLQPALSSHAAGMPDLQHLVLTHAWPGVSSGTSSRLDCTVIVDAGSGDFVVHDGTCDSRVTPASTFKIAISLMGFDSGVLRDEHTPYLPYKPSYAASIPSWRQGTDPSRWLQESVVWYSEQVKLRLGATSVRRYVDAFDYGNRGLPVTAGVDDAVGLSELSPTLTISPVEQTVFLRKLVNHRLPVSALAYDMTTRLLKVETLANGWTVYGKTGTASARSHDGGENSIGWFVGWARKGARTLVFARLLEQPTRADRYGGPLTRDAFLAELARRPL